jgi:hypothetical protein
MDTRTLVLGQDVYMFSGCYNDVGKVVEITAKGVDVANWWDATVVMQTEGTWNADETGALRPQWALIRYIIAALIQKQRTPLQPLEMGRQRHL